MIVFPRKPFQNILCEWRKKKKYDASAKAAPKAAFFAFIVSSGWIFFFLLRKEIKPENETWFGQHITLPLFSLSL